MEKIEVRKLEDNEEILYDLLFLTDPSIEIINDYIYRGNCYVAHSNNSIVGVYVMIRTRHLTLELINIAVKEEYQGKGIGKRLIVNVMGLNTME